MQIFKAVTDKLWKAWQATVENWLLHHAHLCATLFALGSIICLSLGSYEAHILGTLSAKLLSSPTEATPHKFGGLEAFVLDGFKGIIVPTSLPTGVTTAVQAIDSNYQSPLTNPPFPQLHVEPPNRPTLKEQYVADDNERVFLFIPAVTLSDFRRSSQALTGSPNEMKALIPKDSLLANDIRRGANVEGLLRALLNASQPKEYSSQEPISAAPRDSVKLAPQGFTQVYVISATGRAQRLQPRRIDQQQLHRPSILPRAPLFLAYRRKEIRDALPNPFQLLH